MKRILIGCLIFVAVERFCYYQTGTFSLHKMIYEASPPSPTSTTSSIELSQPLKFIGAGKQFYAFETADQKYVVKFMKWSRRRPLPFNIQPERLQRANKLQKSCTLALTTLSQESNLVIPRPQDSFTLIDKLGIRHTVPSSSTHYYVQRKASSFIDSFNSNPSEKLLQSFIETVSSQCKKGIVNLDPVLDRNFGVVDSHVILLDIGSFLQSPKLNSDAAIHHEIVLELLPLREWIHENHPAYLMFFDNCLKMHL